MADETDTMEIGKFKFVGFRTFFIAIILVGAYVGLLAVGKPVGELYGLVSVVIGFMFGMKGGQIAASASKT